MEQMPNANGWSDSLSPENVSVVTELTTRETEATTNLNTNLNNNKVALVTALVATPRPPMICISKIHINPPGLNGEDVVGGLARNFFSPSLIVTHTPANIVIILTPSR